MRIQTGFQNTKNNNEDFALTPYLFTVFVQKKILKIYGIGICWGFYSFYISLAFGVDKNLPHFIIFKK